MDTVLVTGANRGIGLALVGEFLRQDYRVVATARNLERASELRRMARETSPDRLRLLRLDVTVPASIAEAAEAVAGGWGCLDVLMNNAAVFPEAGDESFQELDLEHFRTAFETNVLGVARVCRGFLELLRRGCQPRIVNVSSGAGSIADKTDHLYYCYATSKAALNMFSRGLANELRGQGIIVVAMSPGWVRTEMGGVNAEITPEESARSMVRTVGKLSMEETGLFLSRDGATDEYRW